MTTTRVVCWRGEEPDRLDTARVVLRGDRLTADGSSSSPEYHLRYRLETAPGWVTRRLTVVVDGDGWRRRLTLRRSPTGSWSAAGGGSGNPQLGEPGMSGAPDLHDALDCDLGLCPLTNTMPILRHRLAGPAEVVPPAPVDLVMAWVSVPDLTVHRSPQRYRQLGQADDGATLVEYLSLDSAFRAELLVDGDGLVARYPGIGHRLAAL